MCNLCNKCYTLGMPGPRPDIRCVQYLPKVHYKVPIEFLVPSGTVAAKFEYTAYSNLAAAKISNIFIYGFTYLTSNLHGHFVAEYRIFVTKRPQPIKSEMAVLAP